MGGGGGVWGGGGVVVGGSNHVSYTTIYIDANVLSIWLNKIKIIQ